ncbi:MAG: glycosyltransferase family 2 protein [Candidatus Omnitrophota bacterium]
MLSVSVIISTYNRHYSLNNLLQSLLKQEFKDYFDYEIIIIDNNSNDGTKDLIESYIRKSNRRLKYLFEPQQGKSYALNRGIKEAMGDIIAFTDDDITLPSDWLQTIWGTFLDDSVNVISGRVIPIWPCEIPRWYSSKVKEPIVDINNGNETKEIRYAIGCNMACRRKVFEKTLFLPYCREDSAFSKIIRDKECIVYNPALIVYHMITKQRATKSYFIKWYYLSGNDMARFDIDNNQNFQKWRIRKTLSNIVNLTFNFFNSEERIAHTCKISFFLGYAYRRLVKFKL